MLPFQNLTENENWKLLLLLPNDRGVSFGLDKHNIMNITPFTSAPTIFQYLFHITLIADFNRIPNQSFSCRLQIRVILTPKQDYP